MTNVTWDGPFKKPNAGHLTKEQERIWLARRRNEALNYPWRKPDEAELFRLARKN